MPKTLDLAIFVLTDRQTKPIALPLAHACGVMTMTNLTQALRKEPLWSKRIMFSMALNVHITSILNNPRLLHHEILGAIPHLVLKFEACILFLSSPDHGLSL